MLRFAVSAAHWGAFALTLAPAACSGGGSTPEQSMAGHAGTAGAKATDPEPTSGASGEGGSHSSAGKGGVPGTDAGTAGAPNPGGAGASAGGESSYGGAVTVGPCDATFEQHALSPAIHVELCSAIDYATNPPSSGEHYPFWADFGVYDFPLPRGYWVHNLEHAGVVVTYNCPDGCADEIAQASTWLAGLGPDTTCPAGPARILLVPDPKLDVRWAASSWGFTLRSSCFDPDTFTTFYLAHAGNAPAPEATVCGTGVDFRAADADTCGAK